MEVRDIFIEAVVANYKAHQALHVSSGLIRLWPSELGGCPRKAIYRVAGTKESNPFDDYVIEVIHSGLIWEDWISHHLERKSYRTQVAVDNEFWSGKIDALYGLQVIEVKDTSSFNFRGKRLPYAHHALQVLAYKKLLPGETATIFYHGRGDWAELTIEQQDGAILFTGEQNGHEVQGHLDGLDIDDEMATMEAHLAAWLENSELPPRPYESPFEERFACTKQVRGGSRAACVFCNLCWPELPVQTWYDPGAWIGGEYTDDEQLE
jgi:hypothetical protein